MRNCRKYHWTNLTIFVTSLNKESIDKEISRLGVEALMFWELPKVESALNDLCQQWFYNDCGALIKGTIDLSKTTPASVTDPVPEPSIAFVGSSKEKEQCIELGFVENWWNFADWGERS